MTIELISLDDIVEHPANANVMSDELFNKLVLHLKREDRYPPLIVRRFEGGYQLLDGHHRAKALRKVGRTDARCVVWAVDDGEALVLLATLNRLQGRDDPMKRASLVATLHETAGLDELASQLPERVADLEGLLSIREPPGELIPPCDLADMPVAVHFFLLPVQRRQLNARLSQVGGSREEALMTLVGGEVALRADR